MKYFHLSHTDLDGYGCQLISKLYLDQCNYFNANYGIEVKLSLESIIESIKNSQEKDFTIFISDLNLTSQESKKLNKQIETLSQNGKNIKLQLLDHHATGKESADIYPWYYLDIKRCATKIMYDYFLQEVEKGIYQPLSDDIHSWLAPLVDSINAVDIWKSEEVYNFEFGKVCMQMINKAREINDTLFANENRLYRLKLLEEAAQFYKEDKGYIKLDDTIHRMKKRYLNLKQEDDTIDNISAAHLVKLLENRKGELTIEYKGHKGLLTYTLGSISIPANAFLKSNKDYDFFIDISRNGGASFRADGKVDVSKLAQKLAGGGGHKNASGARFDNFNTTIHYKEVKQFIQEKINELS